MSSEIEALLARAATYSAFLDHARWLGTGTDLEALVASCQAALADGRAEAATIWDDRTGERTDVEPTGGPAGVRARLGAEAPATRSGPGRPRLGVVSREVSLLPRHWDWLASQRGGASAAIRRMVDEARRRDEIPGAARLARAAADKALTVLGGDRPGFEAALRGLYADDVAAVQAAIAAWPADLRAHCVRLAETAAALRRAAAEARPD